MNQYPARPRPGTHPTPGIHRRSSGSRLVRLAVALSGHYPGAITQINTRLRELLRPAGIGAWLTERHLTLARPSRAITPAEWSAIVGWLICQPEVVFVAREYPYQPQPRKQHAAAR